MDSMNIHEDLELEWADIDGEGLVRVFSLANFRSGFVMLAHIGMAAEELDYFPEVLLTQKKMTITIREHSDGLDHRLAHAIDSALHDAAKS